MTLILLMEFHSLQSSVYQSAGALALLEYLIQPGLGCQSLLDFSLLEHLRVFSDGAVDLPVVQKILPLFGRSLKEFVQTMGSLSESICLRCATFVNPACTSHLLAGY